MNLQQVFESHTGRKTTKWTHYSYYYERHLNEFVGRPITILEIGVEDGGSLQVWKKYFGANCKVVGIDVNPNTMYQEPQIFTECGSQTDINFLQRVIEKHGRPDIIIDDGSHVQTDILKTIPFLFNSLNEGGYYIVEDLHTAYWNSHEGGISSPYNFVTVASRFVHDVNKQFIEEPFTPSLNSLMEISFYNSLIFMRKGNPPNSQMTFFGK
jgi:cephalosporin hydroxylase